MGKFERRVRELEKKMRPQNPFKNQTIEELFEIINGHEWTDEELNELAPHPFGSNTYRSLLVEIAQRGLLGRLKLPNLGKMGVCNIS
jgi:hypothetical protein